MSDAKNQGRAVITGASSGIGYELSRLLARDSFDLVLVARSEDKLEHVAGELSERHGVQADVQPMDLATPDAADRLFNHLKEDPAPVEVLVNNAGFATFGPFVEDDPKRMEQMMQLNMVTLTLLTRRFLPGMIERGCGQVLNVASTAAFQPGPLMAVYYASKAYVLHFSEALADELRDTDVSVTALCPGATETSFRKRADMEDSRLFQSGVMSAEEVAKTGYRGLRDGKPVVIPGVRNKVLSLAPRFTPRRLVPPIVRRMQERTSS